VGLDFTAPKQCSLLENASKALTCHTGCSHSLDFGTNYSAVSTVSTVKKNPFQRNLWPYTIIKMLSDRYSICVLNFITAAVWFLHHILYYNLVLPLGIRWHFYTPALICCFIAVSDFLKWIPQRCLESESSACLGSKFDPVSSKSNHLSQILSNSGPGLLKLSFAELSLSIWLHRNQAKLGP